MSQDEKFSPKFVAALQRVAKAGQSDPAQAGGVFLHEMRELGWKERLNNLYRIKDKQDGRFKFLRLNGSQKRFLDNKSTRDIILKARQFGFTTLSCIYGYDRALFDGWSTGVMSHQKERTEKIFDIVKNANEWFIKDWGHLWTPDQESSNTTRISWKESKASITVAYDFRSLTVQFLHVSESAFIDDDRLTASLQSVPENGEVIQESTPNGSAGLFYSHWQLWKKEPQTAPYKGHFFPWYDHYPESPESWVSRSNLTLNETEESLKNAFDLENYHFAWRRWKIQESCKGDEEIFEREYPSNDEDCFLSGESKVYSTSLLKYQKKFLKEPSFIGYLRTEDKRIKFFEDKKALLSIWELPKPEAEYVMGADTAEGLGKDASVAYVLKRETGEIVAELYGQIDPATFAEELYKLGNFYNYCFICPEANHSGSWVIEELVRKGYSKIYKRYIRDEFTQKMTTKLGFYTSTATKIPLSDQHVSACRDGKFRCVSQRLYDEMNNFMQMASKNFRSFRREARPGAHDDCVMAALFAWEMHSKLGDTRKVDVCLPDTLRGLQTDPETGSFIGPSGSNMNSELLFDEFSGF